MSRRLSRGMLTACVSVMAVAVPASARAQLLPGAHFTIAGGAAFPAGDFGTGTDVGYNVAAGLAITQRGSPIGFRAEALYSEFNQPDLGDKGHAGAITGNATYDFSSSLVPASTIYLIGGLGYYNSRDPFIEFDNQSNIGFNVGAGFRFPLTGFSAYVEARYHTISNTDVRFVPLVFGLVF